MIGIDSNYFLLLISVHVCFGSPVGELSGSYNAEEEAARYQNRARVPAALYIQLDRFDQVLFFLSYRLRSRRTPSSVQLEPWLLQVLFSTFLSCAVIIVACMNPASLRSKITER
jgi:hypothetical protein